MTDENYEGLNNALEDLVSEVERLKRIEVNGTFYTIKYYFRMKLLFRVEWDPI